MHTHAHIHSHTHTLSYTHIPGLHLGGGGGGGGGGGEGGHSPPLSRALPPPPPPPPPRFSVMGDMVQLATAEYAKQVCLCKLVKCKQCDSGVYSRQLALQNMFSFGAASMQGGHVFFLSQTLLHTPPPPIKFSPILLPPVTPLPK